MVPRSSPRDDGRYSTSGRVGSRCSKMDGAAQHGAPEAVDGVDDAVGPEGLDDAQPRERHGQAVAVVLGLRLEEAVARLLDPLRIGGVVLSAGGGQARQALLAHHVLGVRHVGAERLQGLVRQLQVEDVRRRMPSSPGARVGTDALAQPLEAIHFAERLCGRPKRRRHPIGVRHVIRILLCCLVVAGLHRAEQEVSVVLAAASMVSLDRGGEQEQHHRLMLPHEAQPHEAVEAEEEDSLDGEVACVPQLRAAGRLRRVHLLGVRVAQDAGDGRPSHVEGVQARLAHERQRPRLRRRRPLVLVGGRQPGQQCRRGRGRQVPLVGPPHGRAASRALVRVLRREARDVGRMALPVHVGVGVGIHGAGQVEGYEWSRVQVGAGGSGRESQRVAVQV
eukprot:scaffold736_cov254-Pinguiococcus_pyrenoidosus.AAC.30